MLIKNLSPGLVLGFGLGVELGLGLGLGVDLNLNQILGLEICLGPVIKNEHNKKSEQIF